MSVIRFICGSLLVGSMFITASWEENASAQNTSQGNNTLTSVQSLFANQPNYMADMTIVLVKDTVTQRFAKKQGKIRCEFSILEVKDGKSQKVNNDRVVVISYPNRTWIGFDPQEKTYCELPESFRPDLLDVQKLYKLAVRTEDDHKVIVENVGTEILGGHEVRKIRISFKDNNHDKGLFLYVAEGLKNLIVKMEVNDLYENLPTRKGQKMSLLLYNISLNVPDAIFQIPKDYRNVDFKAFMSAIKRTASK
jgi:hypothetical protein